MTLRCLHGEHLPCDAPILSRAPGLCPAAMVVFFDKLKEQKLASNGGMAIAFASHPADDERVNFFRQAAGTR
jgi:predicted Zn-dependent protease